jgi:ABC-type Fe3+ transport system substrate-binding protein
MKKMTMLVAALSVLFMPWRAAEAADAKPDFKAAWEKTVAAAKKEGEVRLWGDNEITHPDIVAAFMKEFPFIKAVMISGRVGDLMPRIAAERRAGKYLADLYGGGLGGRAFFDFQRSGVLDPLKPVLMLPDVVDESKWLNGKHHYADGEGQYVFMFEGSVSGLGIFYNTKLVDPKEFRSYWDLLNPKWKGKIAHFERPGTGSPNMVRYYHNPQLGPEFVRRLWTETDLVVSQERRQATDWLGMGKFLLCLDCADTDAARKQGVPVAEFEHVHLKEAGAEIGTSGNSGVALINKAANPNAAKLFLNWFFSRQGQMVWQEAMNNKVVEPSDSMRIDIPKDNVLRTGRRDEAKKYTVTGFQDPEPVTKMLNEIRGKK